MEPSSAVMNRLVGRGERSYSVTWGKNKHRKVPRSALIWGYLQGRVKGQTARGTYYATAENSHPCRLSVAVTQAMQLQSHADIVTLQQTASMTIIRYSDIRKTSER